MKRPLIDQLREHTEYPDSGCWIWTGQLNREGGYGRITIDRKPVLTHRAAYELLVGPIPEGKQLDHLCRTRACWNPDHLEVVTGRENTMRGIGWTAVNAAKTHCVNGHPFDGDNLYVDPSGKRTCRECRREVGRRRQARAPGALESCEVPHGGNGYRYQLGCRCTECRAANAAQKRKYSGHNARVSSATDGAT